MMNHDSLHFQIQTTAPFAFDLALDYLRTSPSSILEIVYDDTYSRALRINGKRALLRIRALPNSLDGELVGPNLEPRDRLAAETIVRRTFAADVDVSTLLTGVQDDVVFAELATRFRGLRPVLIPDLFETIVWAIIGQQVNVRFAAKCKRALVDLCGDRLVVGNDEYLIFPDAERLADVSEADLAAIQFSRQKIRYVLNLAREIRDGRLNLDELWRMPSQAAQERLEKIVGIGRWTAEYVLMRGLGHKDVIPAADGGLRRIIGQAYGLGRSATEEEVRRFAERWAGWRSYAAFYWWFALQQQTRLRSASRERSSSG
jgi:DNA-3-methyladenine glycosylase II